MNVQYAICSVQCTVYNVGVLVWTLDIGNIKNCILYILNVLVSGLWCKLYSTTYSKYAMMHYNVRVDCIRLCATHFDIARLKFHILY